MIFQKYRNVGSRWSPTTENRPTKNLICFKIAKFCQQFKRFCKFWLITNFVGGVGGTKQKSVPRAPKSLAMPLDIQFIPNPKRPSSLIIGFISMGYVSDTTRSCLILFWLPNSLINIYNIIPYNTTISI